MSKWDDLPLENVPTYKKATAKYTRLQEEAWGSSSYTSDKHVFHTAYPALPLQLTKGFIHSKPALIFLSAGYHEGKRARLDPLVEARCTKVSKKKKKKEKKEKAHFHQGGTQAKTAKCTINTVWAADSFTLDHSQSAAKWGSVYLCPCLSSCISL